MLRRNISKSNDELPRVEYANIVRYYNNKGSMIPVNMIMSMPINTTLISQNTNSPAIYYTEFNGDTSSYLLRLSIVPTKSLSSISWIAGKSYGIVNINGVESIQKFNLVFIPVGGDTYDIRIKNEGVFRNIVSVSSSFLSYAMEYHEFTITYADNTKDYLTFKGSASAVYPA